MNVIVAALEFLSHSIKELIVSIPLPTFAKKNRESRKRIMMPEDVVKIPLGLFIQNTPGTPGTWPILRYFKLNEFDSPDEPGSGKNMDSGFLRILDEIRHICGFPFTITSGYRSPTHNQALIAIGREAVDDSAHTHGYAADITVSSSWERKMLVKSALDHGINRLGVGPNFLHIDNDPSKPKDVIWLYGKAR